MTDYIFPPDLEKNPIRFMINTRDYRPVQSAIKNASNLKFRADPLINKNKYVLPIPQQGLNEVFNMEYAPQAMGAIGGSMEIIKNTINNIGAGNYAGALTDAVKGAAENLSIKGLTALSTTIGNAFNADPRQSLGAQEQLLGLIENPNLALLFKGIKLRNHVFSWKFLPRNKEESRLIKTLVTQLKSDALPPANQSALLETARDIGGIELPPSATGQSSFVLGYPCVAFIKIRGLNHDLITFNRHGCVISDIRVSYSEGEVAFFKDSYEPAEINLSIQLQERSIVTREDHNTRIKNKDGGSDPLSSLIGSDSITETFANSSNRQIGGRY